MPMLWYENACYIGAVFDNQSTTAYHHSVNENLSFHSYIPCKNKICITNYYYSNSTTCHFNASLIQGKSGGFF